VVDPARSLSTLRVLPKDPDVVCDVTRRILEEAFRSANLA
jgi:hypothetical protein